MKTDIGVIVARFQVHELHEAHLQLIETVCNNHEKVIIFIGVSPAKSTRKNPLDYKSRELMIRETYPNITTIPLYDIANDYDWSKILDQKIREIYSIGSVTLYGSRDGFIPAYKGKFPTIELESTILISGTEIRKRLSNKIVSSTEFRHGVIYSTYDRYPTTYTTVDAAILDNDKMKILLARKKYDEIGKYRFFGGFVDITSDESFEDAVSREVLEETGSLGISPPIYIGSAKIKDWRYKNEIDGIITSFFKIQYMFGKPEPRDDIDEVKWFDLTKITEDTFVKEHHVLYNLLRADLNKQLKGE